MNMTLDELCANINMPPEATDALNSAEVGLSGECERRIKDGLRGAQSYAAAYGEAKRLICDDSRGFKMLRLMLEVALQVKNTYENTGIDVRVFFDTMGCFSRFVREYKQAFGEYGFDRGWWTGRQLSMRLVRIGELEYEFGEFKGEKVVFLHIPSNADISLAAVEKSLTEASAFIKNYFSGYCGAEFLCESWLLSPSLMQLLPPSSRIRKFADCFTVAATDSDATDYIRWVYKNPYLTPQDFCEDTSLQRSIKKYILGGGKIGNALGMLKRELFEI